MTLDFRYALRTLLKSPGFTLVAILTLALGIGANTAIFSAVDAVLLHPISFDHPEQLVQITKDMPMFGLIHSVASPLDFLDYRALSKSFSNMAAIGRNNFNLTGRGQPQRVPGMRVSASLFPMLGVGPFLGRAFAPDEEQWGRHRVAILGESLWRSRFGSDPRVVGSRIEIEGEEYTVIGVMQPTLLFISEAELWLPLAFPDEQLNPDSRGNQYLDVIARGKGGATPAQMQADLRRVAAQMTRNLPDWYPKGWAIRAEPLSDTVSGPIRTPLLILLGAVTLVLLIGCANVANLLLTRASARQKEIGIRAALGAGRIRIMRQLLIESGLVAVFSGVSGLLIAIWAIDLFSRFGPQALLRGQQLHISLLVAGFTSVVSLFTTVLFGLAPAIAASRVDLNDALKATIRGNVGAMNKRGSREFLMAGEIALSLVLLISAGLLIRSFIGLQQASPGFSPDRVLTAQLSLPAAVYRSPKSISRFYEQLQHRLASLPGVASASAINNLPLSGGNSGGSFKIIGRKWNPNEQPDVDLRHALPGYFDAMRIPLLRGRAFTAQDDWNAPKVAVVDQQFAKQFLAHEDPIGKQISGPGKDTYTKDPYTIVGVVGGVKHHSLSTRPVPTIYYPQLQAPKPAMGLVLRTLGVDPSSLVSAVRKEVASLNPSLPVFRIATMKQNLSASLVRTRFSTTLLGVFALLALLLAAIGVYGVISYTVSLRTREIGIRMALGARSADSLRLILRQGMIPIVAGISVGFAVSLGATRALSSQLYGVSPADPLTFAAVSCLLAAVALAACYFPARRATQVDPMVALRDE